MNERTRVPGSMRRPVGHRAVAVLVIVIAAGFMGTSTAPSDPLAAAITRLSNQLDSPTATGEIWSSVKKDAQPLLARAAKSVAAGRRFLALQQVAAVWSDIEAASYVASRPAAERTDEATFEKEWKRNRALHGTRPAAAVEPLAIDALAEAALLQAGGYFDASLDYARNTAPEYGLYYLGKAHGQQSFAKFARSLTRPSTRTAPHLRPLKPELDSLEQELLAAYRPPASIDRHGEFIAASSTLKEARELDAAGLRSGALVRYLEAVRRTARITAKPGQREEVRRQLAAFSSRLDGGTTDHSIAAMFVEAAAADLESEEPPANATAIVAAVLPRYFAALAPAHPAAAPPKPLATVTLIRWPYT